ncbi:MAG: septum formation protein Maf, partial [Candidatus Lindowbacteria bacterium]|nr:septum formation protein Maf [Candidatus Lindowbacteria bacterium]
MTGHRHAAPIILASSSPRRIELLRSLGLKFEVVPSGVEEDLTTAGPIGELVERNALLKAEDVAKRFDEGLVIGADTIVWQAGKIYGKPADLADARRMLSELVGKTHQVYSGVAVLRIEDTCMKTAHAITDVTFRPLSSAQIERYLQMIDPLDKAGAYAIQDAGGVIIEKICGCYYNVVGLPLTVLDHLLAQFG